MGFDCDRVVGATLGGGRDAGSATAAEWRGAVGDLERLDVGAGEFAGEGDDVGAAGRR